MSGHANPCKRMVRYEFIGELQCALGAGHLAECRVERSTIDVARLCRLSRYEAALQRIAKFDGECGAEATEALDFD